MPELSVIIPAYNEESRLPATMHSVYQYLMSSGRSFELLIVDDGSLDQTSAVAETFGSHNDNVRLVSYTPNQGKGHAVRVGILAARGDLLLIDDADGSSPITELDRLEGAIQSGADVAIGSRAKPDAGRTVKALVHRKYIGNTFNWIVQSLLLKGIYDTQCGFKLFKRKVAHDIFSVAQLNGYGFDVEVLYIARMRGYKIDEVAINWENVEGSKVNVLIDSPKMFLEVIGIKLGALFGRYRKLPERLITDVGLNDSTWQSPAAKD
jgi:dolichyl-phosphate beta-glucosyltransferase